GANSVRSRERTSRARSSWAQDIEAGGDRLLRLRPRREIQVRRRLRRNFPAQERLAVRLVIGVGLFDRDLELAVESLEILFFEGRHHRADLLFDVLAEALLVLRARERAELHELPGFLQLKLGQWPVLRLGRIVELPHA